MSQNASLKSHQEGAESFTFPAHTIALIPLTRQCSKNQKIIAMVATLRALICRGSGISTRIAAMIPRGASSGYLDCILPLREMLRQGGRRRSCFNLPSARIVLFEGFQIIECNTALCMRQQSSLSWHRRRNERARMLVKLC
jgi:hypothetical protein